MLLRVMLAIVALTETGCMSTCYCSRNGYSHPTMWMEIPEKESLVARVESQPRSSR